MYRPYVAQDMPDDETTAESRIRPLPLQPTEVRGLLSAGSEQEIAEVIVSLIADRVAVDRCVFARAGPTAFTVEAHASSGAPARAAELPIEEDLLSQSLAMRRSCVIDDRLNIRSRTAGVAPTEGPECRSLLFVPLADLGVVAAVADPPGRFDHADRQVAEELVSLGESALDQLPEEPSTLDEVADILAHDVQSPLQVALGRVEMAKATGDIYHLEKIVQALRRLEELLEGVVKLIRTGDRVRTTAPIDLDDAVAKVRSTLEMPRAELQVEDSIVIRADENALLQILENLFRNANQHAGPNVTVRVGRLNDGFFVEDDGPGIPVNRREAVFELGVSSGADRTGLGLGIVKRLIEAHGWEIRIVEGRDGGARFEISDVEVVRP